MNTLAATLFAALSVLSLTANVFLVIFSTRLIRKMLSIERVVEKSLDSFDSSYQQVDRLLQTPLATDDPVVRSIHRQMKNVLSSIHEIAAEIAIEFDAVEKNEEDK